MAKTQNLVIVESPSKAKSIKKFLGPDFEVMACMGHLRDLPKSKLGVDIENDFEPQYMQMKGKESVVSELRAAVRRSSKVYLATDPDREGEAMSWHLKYLLNIPEEDALRVTFNEITEPVVLKNIQRPRPIDMNLVNAQQARRILDRLVGYQLSPLLWKKIRRGLSAGRVQSAAARMVVEREEEIRAFQREEYWSIDVHLQRTGGAGQFTARYCETKKHELGSEAEACRMIEDIQNAPFTISAVVSSARQRTPAPPFTTSTLQQEASRKLGMAPKRAMAAAQQLYEGVDVGDGPVGLITYMRTDSQRISEEALSAAGQLIQSRYGAEYYEKPRRYRSKKDAQDAHEAIRPSNVNLDPESIKSRLTNDQYRLYRLIWRRFVASQMSNALYDTHTIDAESAGHTFRANHQSLRFPGFVAVYEESCDDETEEKQEPLPDLKEGETVLLTGADKAQHFTQPPARFNEAALIKAMEENGIGRPSTYAATVSTIEDREYVINQDRHLCPTPLGEVVTEFMKEHFKDVVDLKFTADMEERLDQVEEGETDWKQLLRDFYADFHQEMTDAETALEGVHIKVPDQVTEIVCDQCGRNMVIKYGRYGRFLACPGYPKCTNTMPLSERMPGRCPKCGSGLLKRKSKKGYAYYVCDMNPECGFYTFCVPTEEDCPCCGQTMFKSSGRGQKKTFCINEQCENFTPEEQRPGYRKKKTDTDAAEQTEQTAAPEENTAPQKKTAAKKPSSSKSAPKSAAKKTAAERKPPSRTSAASETIAQAGESA